MVGVLFNVAEFSFLQCCMFVYSTLVMEMHP